MSIRQIKYAVKVNRTNYALVVVDLCDIFFALTNIFYRFLNMTETNTTHEDAYTIDGDLLKVIINLEGQYSIWPAKKETPAGWKETGFSGTKTECSEYVDREWTDMRPLSLQLAMQGAKH